MVLGHHSDSNNNNNNDRRSPYPRRFVAAYRKTCILFSLCVNLNDRLHKDSVKSTDIFQVAYGSFRSNEVSSGAYLRP